MTASAASPPGPASAPRPPLNVLQALGGAEADAVWLWPTAGPTATPELPPPQLFVFLHGWGADAPDMLGAMHTLQAAFPRAVLVALRGPQPVDAGLAGRQWFDLQGVSEHNRPERVDRALAELQPRLRRLQEAVGTPPPACALIGFSQGAIMALALAHADDGRFGRVLAFAGRYAHLPQTAPLATTLHFFHGDLDDRMPVVHAREALSRLSQLGADATLDIAHGVGHELAPVLLDEALRRLSHHIPARTWREALGSVPLPPSESAQ